MIDDQEPEDDIVEGLADREADSVVASRDDVPLLPMPVRLEQKRTSRSLMSAVKSYFYKVYNADPRFKEHLASVSNNTSLTKNRMFDRYIAVSIIQKAAQDERDLMTARAPPGHIYKCLSNILAAEDLGLKLRRIQYRQITHQQAAD